MPLHVESTPDRVAVIGFSDPSSWGSCQTITSNIKLAYRLALGQQQRAFEMGRRPLPQKVLSQIIDEIFQFKPDHIVFTDDPYPHPAPTLLALKNRFGPSLPPITVHVYGDFVLGTREWTRIENELIRLRLRFLTASPSQKKLLENLFKQKTGVVEYCPFPVDSSRYYFDPKIRAKQRYAFGLSSSDRLFVYTGRMTYQKNVLRLIASCGNLMRSNRRVRLFLAGSFDQIGGAYQIQAPALGEFYSNFSRIIAELPRHVQSRLRFLGNLRPDELLPLYNAADAFISFSTYHDEDFGMSPAEALICGADACLTAWGGYPGFSQGAQHIKFVPVGLDSQNLFFEEESVVSGLQQCLRRAGERERFERAAKFANSFSVEAVGRALAAGLGQLPPPFTGFSSMMLELAHRMDLFFGAQSEVFPEGQRRGTFYDKLYRSYWVHT